MSSSSTSGLIATIGGAGLAATGAAHFVAPELFRGITEAAFPDNVDQAMKINGAIETAVGVAIAVPQTRKIGLVALGGYGAYLAANIIKTRRG